MLKNLYIDKNYQRNIMIKRFFDVLLAMCLCVLLALPIVITTLLVRLTSTGSVIYWSDRVGCNNKVFKMPKFRSMRVTTPAVATHLLNNPAQFLTPIGSFLRKSSLDELPQLWSILKGEMSFVGPRPALFNQYDLINLRSQYNVDKLLPGLTGWAQVNGRDELSIADKVKLDVTYMHNQTFLFDLKIMLMTILKVMHRDGVKH